MTPFDAIILGIVEGVTEFLPISSTGHMVLAGSLLGLMQTDFVKTFEIVIQLGAILAVVVLYWKSFLDWNLLKKIAAAFIPTGIIGFALYHVLKTYLLGNEWVVLWSLLLGGIVIIGFEKWHGESVNAKDLNSLSYTDAVVIGLAQSVAIIPGVSRSGATVIGGLARGISRAAIVQFSFLLAVPTMLAATGLDLLKSSSALSGNEWTILGIGLIVSFTLAIVAIRWFLRYVRGHSFTPFGIYRILISIVFLTYLMH